MATTDSPPREPSAYHPTNHFGDTLRDREGDDRPPRHLDGEIINGCISDGTARKVNAGVHHFTATFGGVEYTLAIDTDGREVITGYPSALDEAAARESARWSSQQIEDIREFIETDPRDARRYHEYYE
jgi:hypothetical protein